MVYYYTLSDNDKATNNLALEEQLLDQAILGANIFFLWQNNNSVIIGKNQEMSNECNLTVMQEDQVPIVRRCSGGGAVYHDMGNLNFSFIMDNAVYDVNRQLGVIIKALAKFGIKAHISGRNDLVVSNYKVSGNAFVRRKTHSLHHGTLLFDSNLKAMSKYLRVSPLKLAKHSVRSIASRVRNLTNLGVISIEELKVRLISAFNDEYQCNELKLTLPLIDDYYLDKYQDLKYVIQGSDYSYVVEGILNNDYYKICFRITDNIISCVEVYSDSLDLQQVIRFKSDLINMAFEEELLKVVCAKYFTRDYLQLVGWLMSEVEK